MCGIAGILGKAASTDAIFAMTTAQAHRGPDDHGYLAVGSDKRLFSGAAHSNLQDSFLTLSHLRLSILDCSEAGRQPMSSKDGRQWISYNGEIYNYLELRRELEGHGHSFATGTDTEVILAAYKQWGVGCFSRFNGMWAILIWDEAVHKLIASRDRLGIKPLHYTYFAGSTYFASEIKSILAGCNRERRANFEAILSYLKFSTVNHSNQTFFEGINSFPPGHYAIVDPSDPETIEIASFWSFPTGTLNPDRLEAAEEFRRLFSDAVNLRMRSDVPVGSCLSGGLDSSSIVAIAAANSPRGFHTFTSGFADLRFDESKWANLINRKVGACAHPVTPTEDQFIEDLPNLIWHQDEPFTTASIYAQWCIMREAKQQGITVLLDGQGADEVLGGYRKFTVYYLRELVNQARYLKLARELVSLARNGDRGLLNLSDAQRYLPASLRAHSSNAMQFLTEGEHTAYLQHTTNLSTSASFTDRQKLDLTRYSVPSLLRYEDRNSMAFGIEARVPFLDYRLVEWLLQLPSDLKVGRGRSKAVLRDGMKGVVPDEILSRRDKMGFVTPQQTWIAGNLGRVIQNRFEGRNLRTEGLLKSAKIAAAAQAYRSGKKAAASDALLFKFFLLESWADVFDVSL